jgi:hypothetical protein
MNDEGKYPRVAHPHGQLGWRETLAAAAIHLSALAVFGGSGRKPAWLPRMVAVRLSPRRVARAAVWGGSSGGQDGAAAGRDGCSAEEARRLGRHWALLRGAPDPAILWLGGETGAPMAAAAAALVDPTGSVRRRLLAVAAMARRRDRALVPWRQVHALSRQGGGAHGGGAHALWLLAVG